MSIATSEILTKTDRATAVLLARVLLLEPDAIREAWSVPEDAWGLPWWGVAAGAIFDAIESGEDLETNYPESVFVCLEKADCFWRTGAQDDRFDTDTFYWVMQHATSKITNAECIRMMADRYKSPMEWEWEQDVETLPVV